jgi:hypothetical protein
MIRSRRTPLVTGGASFGGTERHPQAFAQCSDRNSCLRLCLKDNSVNNIIWLVGAIVIVLAILSFFGLR